MQSSNKTYDSEFLFCSEVWRTCVYILFHFICICFFPNISLWGNHLFFLARFWFDAQWILVKICSVGLDRWKYLFWQHSGDEFVLIAFFVSFSFPGMYAFSSARLWVELFGMDSLVRLSTFIAMRWITCFHMDMLAWNVRNNPSKSIFVLINYSFTIFLSLDVRADNIFILNGGIKS